MKTSKNEPSNTLDNLATTVQETDKFFLTEAQKATKCFPELHGHFSNHFILDLTRLANLLTA